MVLPDAGLQWMDGAMDVDTVRKVGIYATGYAERIFIYSSGFDRQR